MQKLSIAIALLAVTSGHAAFAGEAVESGRSQTVSVFDGDSLLTQTSLPSDVTLIVKSDSAQGNEVNGTKVFAGNVILEVRRDSRQLMSIRGDRMIVQDLPR